MDHLHQKCLLCDGARLITLENYRRDFLVKCRACDFVFSQKIPGLQELQEHYATYKRGGSISEITIKRYNELLDGFDNYRKTNHLLDIGCGDGFFLETARQRGWKVYGTEYTGNAIAVCESKGIAMHRGPLDPENYEGITFDVITSFEVIEHINNPQPELKNMKQLLRPGGLLYITTPNFNSVSRYVFGQKWSVIEYPEHLCYYTSGTLGNFLNKNGFKKIRAETTGLHIGRFRNSLHPNQNHNADEVIREKAESKLIYRYLKMIINGFLRFTSKGDNLKVTYVKK